MDPQYTDPDITGFYDIENVWGADDTYCLDLARSADFVLDLGCGTGRLAKGIARQTRAQVIGVDPSRAMLAHARGAEPAGVEWICAAAEDFRDERRFDLIVMTGHAFQTLMTPEARAAVLATMAIHLAPRGQVIFDSRNPVARAWRDWTPERSIRALTHPTFGAVTRWHEADIDEATGLGSYTTFYARSGAPPLVAQAQIAFPGVDEILGLISGAGLVAERVLGDWNGAPFAQNSPEIIPLCRKA